MGISCSRPATLDDYQPTWQRPRIEARPVGSGEQTPPNLKGEEILVPTSSSPRTRPRAESVYNQGGSAGVPRLQPYVYDGEDATPPVAAAPQPVITPQSRGPTMLPVDEPVQWIRGDLIGAGAFGRVYAGLDEATGQLMAVKQVLLCKDNSLVGRVNEQVVSLEKEVAVLKQLDHPNIVRYLGTERTQECLNIFLEFVPGGSIASLLTKFGSLKESVLKIYTRQILTGLEYLHAHQIMHRDIKGANILVDNTGLIKLADFGASKKIEDLVTLESNGNALSIKGTPYWMAPEIIKQSGHGRSADIWSMACTIIEMSTGKPPWGQFSSQVAALFHIANSTGPPPIPQHLSAEAQDFLLLCFTREPKERPNATRLLKHPWLADARPRTLATPLTNISVDNGPLGFRAPRLVIPSSASPSRAGAAPPISPIEEEPEHIGSPGAQPWDNQPMPAAVPSPREPSSPAVPRRGTSDAHSQHDQAGTAYAGRRGPTLMGPPRAGGMGANDQSTPFGQAGGHGPMGESPGSALARRAQARDGPGFGFGLHSPVVKPAKAVENVPPPVPLPLKAVDDGLEAYAALKAQNAAARKAGESPIAPKGNGPPIIHVQAVAGAEMAAAPPSERPSQAPTELYEQDSQNSSMESGSYNPVEEPSWLQCESFDITRYGVMDSISSSPRLRRDASTELLSSLDRACHAALPRTPSSNTNTTVDEPGSPTIGLPPVVESPRFSMRCSGGAGEEELQAYVMKKASVDVVRLSMPFKEKSLNVVANSGTPLTKEALWEAELARELAEQRTLISAHRPYP